MCGGEGFIVFMCDVIMCDVRCDELTRVQGWRRGTGPWCILFSMHFLAVIGHGDEIRDKWGVYKVGGGAGDQHGGVRAVNVCSVL